MLTWRYVLDATLVQHGEREGHHDDDGGGESQMMRL
jgi:hypothetical protein